jgi:hypothetical protein
MSPFVQPTNAGASNPKSEIRKHIDPKSEILFRA